MGAVLGGVDDCLRIHASNRLHVFRGGDDVLGRKLHRTHFAHRGHGHISRNADMKAIRLLVTREPLIMLHRATMIIKNHGEHVTSELTMGALLAFCLPSLRVNKNA